jgi:serine/threonine protein kinase
MLPSSGFVGCVPTVCSFAPAALFNVSPPPAESDDSDIKIADFGFAKRITDLLPKETACGTPGYVAPEILRGDRYGAEVDIWRYVRARY